MKEETLTIYKAEDGTVFEDKASCEKYENDIIEKEKNTTYWVVNALPDLTEGRGYYRFLYIRATINAQHPNPRVWLEDWCYRAFGRKIEFIMGASPMEAWTLYQIDKERFLSPRDNYIGTTIVTYTKVDLVVGAGPQGLVEDKSATENR